MAQKYEDTKKSKATLDKVTRDIARQFGYTGTTLKENARAAAAVKAAKNAKAEKVVVKSPGDQAEAEYARLVKAGKVGPSNVAKVKEQISKKWGVWPNGGTN